MGKFGEMYGGDTPVAGFTAQESEKPFESDAIREGMNYINTGGNVPGRAEAMPTGQKWAQEASARVLGGGYGALKSTFRPLSSNNVENALSIPDRLFTGPLGAFSREIAGKDVTRASGQAADYLKNKTRRGLGHVSNFFRTGSGGEAVPITDNMTYDTTYPGMSKMLQEKLGPAGNVLGTYDRIAYELLSDPMRFLPWLFLPGKTKSLKQGAETYRAAEAAKMAAPSTKTAEGLAKYVEQNPRPIKYSQRPDEYQLLKRRLEPQPELNPIASRQTGEVYQNPVRWGREANPNFATQDTGLKWANPEESAPLTGGSLPESSPFLEALSSKYRQGYNYPQPSGLFGYQPTAPQLSPLSPVDFINDLMAEMQSRALVPPPPTREVLISGGKIKKGR